MSRAPAGRVCVRCGKAVRTGPHERNGKLVYERGHDHAFDILGAICYDCRQIVKGERKA